MQLSKSIASALLLAALSTAGLAQSSPGFSGGLLGNRYAELSYGVENIHGFPDHVHGVGASVNLPISPVVDVGFGYNFNKLDSAFDVKTNTLAAAATLHGNTQGNPNPFATIGLGYQWSRLTAPGFRDKDGNGIWGAAVGIELPFGPLVLTPAAGSTASFESSDTTTYHIGVEVARWFTPRVGGYADATYSDLKGSGGQSWDLSVGVRMRF